jgi:hypothetical protein
MAIKHVAWAHDLEWDFDSPTQRYVFLEMVYWADRKGVVRMSQAEMGGRVLLSRQTVSREIGRLQEIGLVARLDHGRYGIRFQAEHRAVEPKRDDACSVCHEPVKRDEAYNIYYTSDGQPVFRHDACDRQREASNEDRG